MTEKLLDKIMRDVKNNGASNKYFGKLFMTAYKDEIKEAVNAGIPISLIRKQFVKEGIKTPCYKTMLFYINKWLTEPSITQNKVVIGSLSRSVAKPSQIHSHGKSSEIGTSPRIFEMTTTVADVAAGFRKKGDDK